MLETLKISNVALIKNLELNFEQGFNVILGETGAGKSIIIDALGFVLGSKADKTMIRTGEETMKVLATFCPVSAKTQNVVEGFGIECEGDVVLSRTLSQGGKGEARINGEIVSVSMLKQVGETLVDSFNQNESISLLKQKNHLAILDCFKPLEVQAIKEKLSLKIEKLNELSSQIQKLGGSQSSRERQLDILNFQINEIENANLKPNEDEEISETLKKLSNSERIKSAIENSTNNIFSDEGALSLLRQSVSSLRNVEAFDNNISQLTGAIESSLLDLEENCQQLFSLSNDYDFDENSLDALIQRQELIESLKRKYGGSLTAVLKFQEDAKVERETLENAKEILDLKQKEKQALLENAKADFNELSALRKKHAKEIEQKICNGLCELGMGKAKFEVNFFEINKIEDVSVFSINCLEDVEFMFSANFGEQLKPLAKTISGGEMNRFMLVFKTIIADENGCQTLVFDEIDAGISGQIAKSVAQKISSLAKTYQIICISHLPQVAACGDAYLYVSKFTQDARTQTSVKKLENDEIAKEIAILTYGSVDDKKLELTKEMLKLNKHN